MGLPKGKTNNPKGRPRGSRNKINYDLREVIGEFLAKRLCKIDDVYDQLTPREQAKFIIDLLNFALPKLQTIEKESEKSDEQINVYEQINRKLIEEGYEPKTPITVDRS